VLVTVIGNEGGFLGAPVDITKDNSNQLLIDLAEWFDVIFDFIYVPLGNYILSNVGPDELYGGRILGVDFFPADPTSTGQIMEFHVILAVGPNPITPTAALVLPTIMPLPAEAPPPHRLALLKSFLRTSRLKLYLVSSNRMGCGKNACGALAPTRLRTLLQTPSRFGNCTTAQPMLTRFMCTRLCLKLWNTRTSLLMRKL